MPIKKEYICEFKYKDHMLKCDCGNIFDTNDNKIITPKKDILLININSATMNFNPNIERLLNDMVKFFNDKSIKCLHNIISVDYVKTHNIIRLEMVV